MTMKIIMILFLLAPLFCIAQCNDFKEIEGVELDSVSFVASRYPGWKVADTAEIRCILSTGKAKGFSFVSCNTYEGDNLIEVENRKPLRMIASGDPQSFYNLLLVHQHSINNK